MMIELVLFLMFSIAALGFSAMAYDDRSQFEKELDDAEQLAYIRSIQ